jgi:TRAP-type mannitol/chloroaromatic compound transport system permease small subunit
VSAETRHDVDDSTRGFVADMTATFGGVLLLIASAFDILQGGSAVANDDLYSQGSDYLYKFDMDVWGWVHVVLGVISIAVAVGIIRRVGWGQLGGMIVAGLGILTNFAALPHYPIWSVIVIAFYALVMWSLSVQMKNYR